MFDTHLHRPDVDCEIFRVKLTMQLISIFLKFILKCNLSTNLTEVVKVFQQS